MTGEISQITAHLSNNAMDLLVSGKKREETVKPTFFIYVESDFGTTDKSFTVFFAR